MNKVKIYFILNDNDNSFIKLYGEKWSNVNGPANLGKFQFDSIDKNENDLYIKSFAYKDKQDLFSNDYGKAMIDNLIDYCKQFNQNIKRLFIDIRKNGLTQKQIDNLLKKYSNNNSYNFYNFGRTYILNETFFNSDYSLFQNNIAHEVINTFMADDKKRYFYLCKNGRINDFIINEAKKNLPSKNYIDLSKTILINFSKTSDCDTAEYTILQRISNFSAMPLSFNKVRNDEDYNNINYNNVNICDIFKSNSYTKINKNTGAIKDSTENYPYITFKLNKNGSVMKPKTEKKFSLKDSGFSNLSKSSCRQFVMEGTTLFDSIDKIVKNENDWEIEAPLLLEEYIKSEDFKNDNEEDFLLKIINSDAKEIYYSKLITYALANSLSIAEDFCKKFIHNDIKVKQITNIYNEKYNMDISFTFIDENNDEHLVVIENKINAKFTDDGVKNIASFFSKKDTSNINKIAKALKELKNQQNNLQSNQLTKYYQIAHIIADKENIKDCNIHMIILAPEYKINFCSYEKDKYYYGNKYKVISYKDLKKSIDICQNDKLSTPVKDIITQLNRAIWPYTSSSHLQHKRIACNRFAKESIKIKKQNEYKSFNK